MAIEEISQYSGSSVFVIGLTADQTIRILPSKTEVTARLNKPNAGLSAKTEAVEKVLKGVDGAAVVSFNDLAKMVFGETASPIVQAGFSLFNNKLQTGIKHFAPSSASVLGRS